MVRQSTNTKCLMLKPAANAAISGCPTPMVNLKLKVKKNDEDKLATLHAQPDTGASIDGIEENIAKKHNLVILLDNHQMSELVSAEGKMMKVLGTTKLSIQAPGGGWTTTVALVCPQLSHQFLLSWIMQKKLQLLHQGWPFTHILVTHSATLSEVENQGKRHSIGQTK